MNHIKSGLLTAMFAAVGAMLFASCSDEIVIGNRDTSEEFGGVYENNVYLRDGQTGQASAVVELSGKDYVTPIKVGWSKAGGLTVPVKMHVDADYLAVYNQQHATDFSLYPLELVSFENEGVLTPDASKNQAELKMTIRAWEEMEDDKTYAIPVTVAANTVRSADGNGMNVDNIGHCVYLVKGMGGLINEVNKGEGLPKGFLFFEVNEVNPLNALGFRLENGKLLWDVVVLFAANINKDPDTGMPRVTCNDNVQFLLDNNEEFLQPLRKHGIKVLLGLLGNHDETGLAQLSDMGAKYFAAEVASYCERYNLDGVNYDDEYSKLPDLSNPALAPSGYDRAARLCYETRLAMPDKLVTVFSYGHMGHTGFPTEIEGKPIREWVDIVVPNYGGRADAHGSLTNKECAYFAMELASGGGGDFTKDKAEGLLNGGYGWFMGFAPNPKNYQKVFSRLRQGGAETLYGSELLEPTIYYRKRDANPYPYDPNDSYFK